MFQPNAANLVRHCQQQFVVIEMVRPKRQPRFGDHVAVEPDLFGRRRQLPRLIGDHVEGDALAQLPLAKIGPRKDRRIDQRLIVGFSPRPRPALLHRSIERGRRGPPCRESDARLEPDLAHVMPGRVQAHLLPLQVEHRGGHRDAPFARLQRRGVDEPRGDRTGARRQDQLNRINLDRVALPGQLLPARIKAEPDQFRQGTARAVIARQPLREQQRQIAGSGGNRDRLDHAVNPARNIAGVNLERDGSAGISQIGGIGHQT